MATKRRIKCPACSTAIASAAVGTVLTFNLDLDHRYHDIDIVLSDGANAQLLTTVLGDAILFVNDNPQRTHTALELDGMNGENGTQYLTANKTFGTSGTDREQVLTMYLDQPWRKGIVQGDQTALNANAANGVVRVQVKITVLVALSATASITLWAMVDDCLAPPKSGAWPITKVYRTGVTGSGTNNEVTAAELPSTRGMYQGIHFKQPTTGTIQYVTVANGGSSGVKLWDKVSQYEQAAFLTGRGMNPFAVNPAAGLFAYSVIFDAYDPLQDAVSPATNGLWAKVEYTAGTAATGNVVILAEVLGTLD